VDASSTYYSRREVNYHETENPRRVPVPPGDMLDCVELDATARGASKWAKLSAPWLTMSMGSAKQRILGGSSRPGVLLQE